MRVSEIFLVSDRKISRILGINISHLSKNISRDFNTIPRLSANIFQLHSITSDQTDR